MTDIYKLDDACCSRRDLPKGVYVRHDIVPAFFLFLGCNLELLRGEMLHTTHTINIMVSIIYICQNDHWLI